MNFSEYVGHAAILVGNALSYYCVLFSSRIRVRFGV